MSEEDQSTDSQVENDESDNQEQENQQKSQSKPAGYDPVALDSLPEEMRKPLEERFRYMYGQIKNGERYTKQTEKTLNEYRTLAEEQAQKIEELMSGVGQVVDHIHNQSTSQAEAQLKSQLALAHENGDFNAVAEITTRILEIQATKNQPKKQPEKKEAHQSQVQANDGIEFTPYEDSALDAWQTETDQNGKYIRSWAHENDPMFPVAFKEAQLVLTSPAYKNLSIEEKLSEVDRRMGLKRNQPNQNVMGSNLTSRGKPSSIKLSPEIEKMAIRMKYGGSNAKSDQDHIDAYRKRIEKTKSSNKRNR